MTPNIGEKIGHLTIVCETSRPAGVKDQHRFWLCKCDCGKMSVVSGGNIGRGVKSCGCQQHTSRPVTHGYASHKRYDKIYHTWNSMKYRCYNRKSKDFPHYGQRGIKVCDQWKHDFLAFRKWALENGFADNLTIDRIDVDGDYCPENCRWATVAEQNRNKTTTRRTYK